METGRLAGGNRLACSGLDSRPRRILFPPGFADHSGSLHRRKNGARV